MGLAIMILGLAALLGGHAFVTFRAERAGVISRIGEGPYKGLFSVVALAGIVLISYGFAQYRASGLTAVCPPPTWPRHLAVALMWPAVICVVAAYIRGDIQRVLEHPMLVGV